MFLNQSNFCLNVTHYLLKQTEISVKVYLRVDELYRFVAILCLICRHLQFLFRFISLFYPTIIIKIVFNNGNNTFVKLSNHDYMCMHFFLIFWRSISIKFWLLFYPQSYAKYCYKETLHINMSITIAWSSSLTSVDAPQIIHIWYLLAVVQFCT